MRSRTRAFTTRTSTAGTRPRPPARGSSRCETTPRSVAASDARAWRWRCGGKSSTNRSMVSIALTVDMRRDHQVADLRRLEHGPRGVVVA